MRGRHSGRRYGRNSDCRCASHLGLWLHLLRVTDEPILRPMPWPECGRYCGRTCDGTQVRGKLGEWYLPLLPILLPELPEILPEVLPEMQPEGAMPILPLVRLS